MALAKRGNIVIVSPPEPHLRVGKWDDTGYVLGELYLYVGTVYRLSASEFEVAIGNRSPCRRFTFVPAWEMSEDMGHPTMAHDYTSPPNPGEPPIMQRLSLLDLANIRLSLDTFIVSEAQRRGMPCHT